MSYIYFKKEIVAFLFATGTLLVLFFPFFAGASGNGQFAGQVTAVLQCINLKNASLISVNNASTSVDLVYQAGSSVGIPTNVVPQKNELIYGFYNAGQTCLATLHTSSAQVVYYVASSTSLSGGPLPPNTSGNGSNSGNSIGNLLKNLGSSVFSKLKSLIPSLFGSSLGSSVGSMLGSSQGGGGASSAGIGIFGGLFTLISPCDEGFLYAVAGVPYSGPLMWVYGVSSVPPYLYAMGTPPIPGTYGIGHYSGFSTCTLGIDVIGAGPIMYGYGTSLPAGAPHGTPPAATKPNPSCPQSQFSDLSTNSADKTLAESNVRSVLSSEGITVNKSACSLQGSFRNTTSGCTDVSGLQCTSMTDLSQLASKCGAFQITGGSEGGHATHGAGNAVDVANSSSFNSCVEASYTQTNCAKYQGDPTCWVDPLTGTTYWQESGSAAGSTGAHWHICFGGKGC